MKRKLTAGLTAAILVGAMGTSFAAALSPEQEEINLLKARLAALEEKVRLQEELAVKQQAEAKPEKAKKKEVEFGGDARVRFRDEGDGSKFDERFRFTVKMPINDDAYFFSRWVMVNNNRFGETGEKDGGTVYNASMHYNNFLGEKGLEMAAGRIGLNVGATQYLLAESTGRMDGVKFTKKQKGLSYTLGYADFSAQSGKGDLILQPVDPDKPKDPQKVLLTPKPQLGESVFATVEYDASKATKLYGSYIKETSSSKGMKFDYRGIGVKTQVAENLKLLADYSYNNAYDDLNEGFYASLRWRETSYSKPGSFEFRFDYRDIETNNMYGTGLGNVSMPQKGYRGPGLSFLYVPVLNTRIAVHQTFASKYANTGKGRDNFTRVDLQVKL